MNPTPNISYLDAAYLRSRATDAADIYVYLLALRNAVYVLTALYPYAPAHLRRSVVSVLADLAFAREVGRRAA